MNAVDQYGLWGRYLIHRNQRNNVAAVVRGTPVFSAIANFSGDALTVDGSGVALTPEEWGEVHAAILACSARARGGFVEVRCRDRFDTRFPARG